MNNKEPDRRRISSDGRNRISLSRSRIFLLSPANLAGIRAGYILRANANSALACRLRQNGVPLGELFSFVSGLYFRGKLAYARAFALPPPSLSGSFVITATGGLLPPETVVTLDRLREFAASDIDPNNERYRAPLDHDCRLISDLAGSSCDVVLLGSGRDPQVRGTSAPCFSRALGFSRRIRRTRRYEPGRAYAALRRGTRGTCLHSRSQCDSLRPEASEASAINSTSK